MNFAEYIVLCYEDYAAHHYNNHPRTPKNKHYLWQKFNQIQGNICYGLHSAVQFHWQQQML